MDQNTLKDVKIEVSDMMLQPYWSQEQQPRFLSRTDTVYSKSSISELKARGIENRLLDSLCAGLTEGAVIAGGFMLSVIQGDKQAKDVDIFFTNEKALEEMIELLEANSEMLVDDPEELWAYHGYKCQNLDKATRFYEYKNEKHPNRPNIQLIKLVYYDSPEHVIDSFDFTVAQFATDGKSLYFNPMSVLDAARKRLVLHRMQFPASTMRRLVKYASKGYYACPGALERIAAETHAAISQDPTLNGGEFVYLD